MRAKSRRCLWPLTGLALLAVWAVVVGGAGDFGRGMQIAQIGSLGRWAPAAYVLVYVGATLVGAPGMPFALLAPVIFGTLPGFLIMVLASSVSATLAFLIARHVARNALTRRFVSNVAFGRVSALVEEHRWIVIFGIRMVPVFPFAVINYGLGLSRIPFWQYALCSEVAMVLENAVLVTGASALDAAVLAASASWVPLQVAAAAAVVVFGLGGWAVARRRGQAPWRVPASRSATTADLRQTIAPPTGALAPRATPPLEPPRRGRGRSRPGRS